MGSWLLCRRPRRTPEPAGILAASRRHIPVLFVLPSADPARVRTPHGRIGDPWRLGDIRPLANPFQRVRWRTIRWALSTPIRRSVANPCSWAAFGLNNGDSIEPPGAPLCLAVSTGHCVAGSRAAEAFTAREGPASRDYPQPPPIYQPLARPEKDCGSQGAMSIRAFPLRDTLKDSGVLGPNPPKRSSSLSTTRCQCPGESLTHTTRHSGLKLRRPSAAVPSALLRSSVSTRSSSRRASRRRLPPTPKIGCRRRSSRSRWW